MGNTEQKTTNPASSEVWNGPRQFELEVFDITIDDRTGKQIPQKVTYTQPVIVTATSKADMNEKLMLYKQCGQFARILREIPTENTPPPRQPQQQQPIPVQNQSAKSCPLPYVVPASAAQEQQIQQKSDPKYYKIGDIEIKIENGKSYQRQFVALTDEEAKNIRIVDDKTNRIVNIKGKHIEVKKWIYVEPSDESTDLDLAAESN